MATVNGLNDGSVRVRSKGARPDNDNSDGIGTQDVDVDKGSPIDLDFETNNSNMVGEIRNNDQSESTMHLYKVW